MISDGAAPLHAKDGKNRRALEHGEGRGSGKAEWVGEKHGLVTVQLLIAGRVAIQAAVLEGQSSFSVINGPGISLRRARQQARD